MLPQWATTNRVPRYECRGDRQQCSIQRCQGFGGARVDQAVVAEVLEAIRPVGIQAALDAWDQSQDVEDERQRALQLALEKARYESNRIERQYEATEPENRLVAAELEKRWNAALAHVADLEARVAEVKGKMVPLGKEQHQQLLALGEDLERLWDHPACPTSLKKRVLRTVLKEIIATQVGKSAADHPEAALGRRSAYRAGGTKERVRTPQSGQLARGD
jgi:hypothetical protein